MAFVPPKNVGGWLHPLEGETLQNLAVGKRVVEIGSFEGLSTITMARVASVVVSIDPFDACENIQKKDTFPTFRQNLITHGVKHKIVAMVALSRFACPLLRRDTFDLGFIDGDHGYNSVCLDIAVMEPLICKSGGVIAFHDYEPKYFPGVVQAVDEWRGNRRIEITETLAVVWL